MADIPSTFAFTYKSNGGILNRLISTAHVVFAGNTLAGNALWDTGATGTFISHSVVQSLALVPTGQRTIRTPQGETDVNTYLVDIILPNSVKVENVVVCDSEIGAQGIDVLVGMDIIGIGDFAVSNYGGRTCFSFRYPSRKVTDYVIEINKERSIGGKHGKGKRKRK